MSDNYIVCKNQLLSLKRSFVNKGILDKYNSILSNYETIDIVERVPLSEIPKKIDKVHYLSHRPGYFKYSSIGNASRQSHGIGRERKTIKDILRKCVRCTRCQWITAKPNRSQDLSEYRVNYLTHAFQATGLDFAGPLFVKEGSKKVKAYILLLTCASSNTIHIFI